MLECWEWDEKKRPTFYQLVDLFKNNNINSSNSCHTIRKSISIDDHQTNNENVVQF